ncbi:MAG: Gfo/Idh/MocA family protein [Capsulimonadaceae bacterium]
MSKVRFGIVGCGVIFEWHAVVLQNLSEDAELVAVCDIMPERARATSLKYGAEAYTRYEDMLKAANIDVVTVCTPSGLHAGQAIAALESGRHVVVEKPIDVNLTRADALVAAAARHPGLQVTPISQNRYGAGIIQLHEWLDRGKLGRLLYGEATIKWFRNQAYYDSAEWRGTWALDGGGALMNQGVHYADQLRWALGRPKSVMAHAATLAHKIEVEDVVSATFEFESGAIGTLTATTCAFPGYDTTLEIVGTEGTVRIAGNEIVSARFKDGEVIDGIAEQDASGSGAGAATGIGFYLHTCQLRDFIASVRDGRSPAILPKDGRDALEVVVGVYESARTGKRVSFPLASG